LQPRRRRQRRFFPEIHMKRLIASMLAAAAWTLAVPAFAACTTATQPNTLGTSANASYEAILAVCDAAGGANTPLGYQQITSLSSATALTVPTGATVAVIIPETQAIRWRDDGTNPTASVGMPLASGQPMTLKGAAALAAARSSSRPPRRSSTWSITNDPLCAYRRLGGGPAHLAGPREAAGTGRNRERAGSHLARHLGRTGQPDHLRHRRSDAVDCFYVCATWAEEIHTINSAGIGLYSHSNTQGSKIPTVLLRAFEWHPGRSRPSDVHLLRVNPIGTFQVGATTARPTPAPEAAAAAACFCYADENWDSSHHGSHCSIYGTPVGQRPRLLRYMAFGGKDPQGNGSGIKIITYKPIAFACLTNSCSMFKTAASGVGINALLADESGNAFLSGSFLQAGSATPAGGAQAGDLVLAKETDAAAAPGAGFCVIKAVAGTNAGSGKLIARCGTSTTAVTITDNIGSGF
jgi:hypothetical protein